MPSASQPIPAARPAVTIRRATPEDAPVCGTICYKAFHRIASEHAFPPDVPSVEVAVDLLAGMFSHPNFYCIVAEQNGRIVGSNCLDERSAVGGIGPVTVDPEVQNLGIGRKLMEAVIERTREKAMPGVRLVQGAYHNRSFALYMKLGFDVREPLVTLQGTPVGRGVEGCRVRPAQMEDIEACSRVCMQVHGHDRGGELADAIGLRTARVVEREGRITGYATALAFFGHAAGLANVDIEALIGQADRFLGPGILVPARNAELLRWCLDKGLRIVQPLTLMTMGLYHEPQGAYLPSILY
jgi:predicted N-acetyltransferase YhbS